MCIFARDKTGSDVVRRKRLAVWTFALFVAAVVLLPLGSYVYTAVSSAQAASEKQTNPRANYWRAVRDGNQGYTAVQGRETGVLIQNGGQNWRQARNGPVANVMPWVLAFTVAVLFLVFLYRGQVKLDKQPSGRTVARYNIAERVLHWYTAILFIILSLTGLSMLFGRAVLIPVLGLQGFSAWANFSITLHNYLGPFFIIGLALMIIWWIKDNIPSNVDWEWFRQGMGGILVKGKHPSAGRFNAGEKIFVFWIGLVVLGIITSVSGLYLIGWIGSGMRETMQSADIVHAVAAVFWTSIIIGHIYLGVSTQGAIQGMWKGEVSEEWARQHHDLWYQEAKKG
jgi:formate dehydrogenase subunit gamma